MQYTKTSCPEINSVALHPKANKTQNQFPIAQPANFTQCILTRMNKREPVKYQAGS